MRIGIDCDETLAELMDGFLKWHQEKYGRTWKREEVKDYYSVFGNDTWRFALFDEFCHSQRLGELAPVPGSKEAIAELAENHELHVITARADYTIPITQAWLKRHYATRSRKLISYPVKEKALHKIGSQQSAQSGE